MALTIEQIIPTISEYTVGLEGDISTSELATLTEMVAGDLTRMNPGFSGNDLVELEAYLVLHKWEGKPSGDNIKSEKIKDHSWTFKDSSLADRWLEAAQRKISTYNQAGAEYGCVERVDSEMVSMAADMIEIERFYES